MLYTIVVFILVLGVLVCVHELGHFLVAKWSGVRVHEFGFGFPPRIFGKKVGDTEYTLNALPLGGFVRLKGVVGDDTPEDQLQDPDSFAVQPFWKKVAILFAGIFMNLLLAAVFLSIVHMLGVTNTLDSARDGATVTDQQLYIGSVLADSPAATAELQAGDRVVAIAGTAPEGYDEFRSLVSTYEAGESFELTVLSAEDEERTVSVASTELQSGSESYVGLGVGLQEVANISYPVHYAVWYGVSDTGRILLMILVSLWQLVLDMFGGVDVGDQLAGPVGIAVITGEVARQGIAELLHFSALLSINLALFNFLPIPALDGGRIIFVVLERIRRKPVSAELEARVHQFGFLALLLLIVLVTFKDIVAI